MSRKSLGSILKVLLLGCTVISLCGCNEMARTGWKGAIEQAGAKVVEASSGENLRDMFEAANSACPTRIDAFTTLEEVEMIDDQRVEFRYQVNRKGKEFASRLDKQTMKRAMVAQMKGNPMAVAIAERDLSIEHIYEDSAGNHILSYTINRAVLEGDLEPLGDERANPLDVTTVKSSGSDQLVEEPVEKKPPMPQQYKPPRRTKDNPAGVHSNPYFNET